MQIVSGGVIEMVIDCRGSWMLGGRYGWDSEEKRKWVKPQSPMEVRYARRWKIT
jgi:hypothetical protein